jgi:CRISPR/Cas system-associated exonuclease Cas4 (RecB family)
MGWDFGLSASKLNLMKECRRCFWDANVKKIERPRGIFPGLPGGVDRVMKQYCDKFRGLLPPTVTGLEGKLWGTTGDIAKLRHWKSGYKANLRVGKYTVNIIGALDDLIVEPDDTYSPYDVKTKGDLPKTDGAEFYQLQVDLYALLLLHNNKPPSGKAYLDYYYPVVMEGYAMAFEHKLFTLVTDSDRAIETIEEAVDLMTSPRPASNPECEYCKFADARTAADLTMKEAVNV